MIENESIKHSVLCNGFDRKCLILVKIPVVSLGTIERVLRISGRARVRRQAAGSQANRPSICHMSRVLCKSLIRKQGKWNGRKSR